MRQPQMILTAGAQVLTNTKTSLEFWGLYTGFLSIKNKTREAEKRFVPLLLTSVRWSLVCMYLDELYWNTHLAFDWDVCGADDCYGMTWPWLYVLVCVPTSFKKSFSNYYSTAVAAVGVWLFGPSVASFCPCADWLRFAWRPHDTWLRPVTCGLQWPEGKTTFKEQQRLQSISSSRLIGR